MLLAPIVSEPKLMDEGFTLPPACATLAKENRIVAAATIAFVLILLLAAMFIAFPNFRSDSPDNAMPARKTWPQKISRIDFQIPSGLHED